MMEIERENKVKLKRVTLDLDYAQGIPDIDALINKFTVVFFFFLYYFLNVRRKNTQRNLFTKNNAHVDG